MMKNPSSPSPEFDRDREFTVVLERLRTEFQIFGEGLSLLTERVDKLDGKLDGLNNKFEGLCINQARTLESIIQIRFDIKTINGRLDRLESSVA